MKPYRYLIVAVLVLLAIWYYGHTQRMIGEANQRIKAREHVIAVLAGRVPEVDTVAGKAQTVYLAAKVNYKAIRDSIMKELAQKVDTTKPENVPPVIRSCDASLEAADSALMACARKSAVRDTIIWQQDSLIREIRKQHRSPFLGCRLGVTVTPKGFGPGVTCGIGR